MAELPDGRLDRMIDNGRTPAEGRLWLVGPPVNVGRSWSIIDLDENAVFDFVIDTAGLGSEPAVLYDPKLEPAELRYYPEGLLQAENCEVVAVEIRQVDLNAVLGVVDQVHKKILAAPGAPESLGGLWSNPDRFQPVERAELTVQAHLKTALSVPFPDCSVRTEQIDIPGRLDIEIVGPDLLNEHRIISYVVLELKILRSYRSGDRVTAVSPSEIVTWVGDGVDQAYSYRLARGSLESALCCFDMRKTFSGRTCFDHVADKAASLDVRLEVWHLFASTKAYREHQVSEALRRT
ncbi:hypothetical protein [Micromonospora arborensis]|uniref:hypothetical protein n=1 Tax=Micromonospora arborensis TaxID=2116518 RepID=UPI0011B71656|nr:hypothetical protein [Micromonospora arborensis]